MTTSELAPSEIGLTEEAAAARERPPMRRALTASLAMLRRDVLVTQRQLPAFLAQVMVQPLLFLFVFGTVLPSIGLASRAYAPMLLPGIVALTVMTGAFQSITLPLVLDLGYAREIDDRLLAPAPIAWVALEKALYAALRGCVAGAVVFPLARVILAGAFHVRGDHVGAIVGIMLLIGLAGAGLGLLVGTLVKPESLGLMFALVFTPLVFLGCTYYPWAALAPLRWFQLLTLANPLTYGSEGLRGAMVPPIAGVVLPTLSTPLVATVLSAFAICFIGAGAWLFHRRVIT
jgi:ABC-2 type transport system permease protein